MPIAWVLRWLGRGEASLFKAATEQGGDMSRSSSCGLVFALIASLSLACSSSKSGPTSAHEGGGDADDDGTFDDVVEVGGAEVQIPAKEEIDTIEENACFKVFGCPTTKTVKSLLFESFEGCLGTMKANVLMAYNVDQLRACVENVQCGASAEAVSAATIGCFYSQIADAKTSCSEESGKQAVLIVTSPEGSREVSCLELCSAQGMKNPDKCACRVAGDEQSGISGSCM